MAVTLCEALLLFTLVALLFVTSFTDVKDGLIKNQHLFCAGSAGVTINIIYAIVTDGAFVTTYLTNLFMIAVSSLLMYALHIWSAGDSKLLITIACCLPGRFLTFWDVGLFPSFFIISSSFIVAFVYAIAESILLGIRNKELLMLQFPSIDMLRMTCAYLFTVPSTMLANAILMRTAPWLFEDNHLLLMAVDFLMVITLVHYRNRMQTPTIGIAAASLWIIVFVLFATGKLNISPSIHVTSWLFVLLIMAVCIFAGKYNYQTIPTSEIAAGMIPAASTVVLFQTSRVKGLPHSIGEDMGSRLTQEEADSIKRWERSSQGMPYVSIVRKLPFGIFINIGCVLFFVFEVIARWY